MAFSQEENKPNVHAEFDALMIRLPFTDAMAKFGRFANPEVSEANIAAVKRDLSWGKIKLLGIASCPVSSRNVSDQSALTYVQFRKEWAGPGGIPQNFGNDPIAEPTLEQMYWLITRSRRQEWLLGSIDGEYGRSGFSTDVKLERIEKGFIDAYLSVYFHAYKGSRPKMKAFKLPEDVVGNGAEFAFRNISTRGSFRSNAWYVAYRGVAGDSDQEIEILLIRFRSTNQ